MKKAFLIVSVSLGIILGIITHRPIKSDPVYLSLKTNKAKKIIDSNEVIDTSFSYIKLLSDNKFRVCQYIFLNCSRKNFYIIKKENYFVLPEDTTSYIVIRKIVDQKGVKEAVLWAKNKADNIIKQQKQIDKF